MHQIIETQAPSIFAVESGQEQKYLGMWILPGAPEGISCQVSLDAQLQKLPANSSKIRKHNRCGLTGRPRGYMRQFGISRVTFREMALAGKIPGVKKASW